MVLWSVYLDHVVQRAGEHPPELSSDVQHVHLTATCHHSDQGVVISPSALQHKKINPHYDDHLGTQPKPLSVCKHSAKL